jgi:hypothetical protein
MLVLVMAGATDAASSTTPQAWFDEPLPASHLALGVVTVTAHATSPDGVEEVELAVDGVRSQSADVVPALLVTARFQWVPEREKGYSLSVRARSGDTWGEPSTIFVIVGSAPTSPSSACQSANVLLSEDFSTGAGTLETYDFDTVAAGPRDGAFHLTFSESGDVSHAVANQQLGDVCIEADVVDVGPQPSGRYGVFCRLPAEGTYYEFFIDSSGRAGTRIASFLGGPPGQAPVYWETDAVNAGLGAVNRVRGDCVGSSFTMWVNDRLVGSFEEPTTTTGDVGIFATSVADGGTDVAFDNLRLLGP